MGTKEQNRKYYEKNKAKYIEHNKVVRIRNFEYVKAIKEATPCMDCDVKYPHYVMDFDHIEDDKIADISTLCKNHYSIARIQEEIDKCELVCSNCHRERTFSRFYAPVVSVG